MVAESAHRLRFAVYACQPLRVESVRLDHRHGDVPGEPFVVREVDALATSLPQEPAHGVSSAREGRGEGK